MVSRQIGGGLVIRLYSWNEIHLGGVKLSELPNVLFVITGLRELPQLGAILVGTFDLTDLTDQVLKKFVIS